MTELLHAAEQAVAYAVAEQIHAGEPVAVGTARTDTHHVVGLGLRLTEHPCGAYSTHPPVVVSFQREQWTRIAVYLKDLGRRA